MEKSVEKIAIPVMVRVKDLALLLNLPVTRVIKELMKNNIFATINQEIDFDTAAVIADDLGYAAEKSGEEISSNDKLIEDIKSKNSGRKIGSEPNLLPRAPVVTVMGHVDHGKTTLLDYIRKTNVADKEVGGITQKISIYQIKYKDRDITFMDTPGHEAFANMRARGASLMDVAILVIAADDGIKPQTREVLEHIKKAKIPFVVAINKIDKEGVNVDKIKQELAQLDVQIEEWGGKTPLQEISAKTGQDVDQLLDIVLLLADMENLKADFSGSPIGTVIESHLSPKRGIETIVLIQSGTLKLGDNIVASGIQGKIKRMENLNGQLIKEAIPSMPVKIIGLPAMIPAGNILQANVIWNIEDNSNAQTNKQKILQDINQRALNPKIQKVNFTLKSDSHGSEEAILTNLAKIHSDNVAIYIIQSDVGQITESDILKSHITGAKLIGFNVEATPVARDLAKQLGINIHQYRIIYELIDEVKKGLEEILEPEEELKELGQLKVLVVFLTERVRMIVGGKVTLGTIETNSKIRVKRGEQIIGEGTLGELQSGKQKASKVVKGHEAGVKFNGETKILVGDILEFYRIEKKKKTL